MSRYDLLNESIARTASLDLRPLHAALEEVVFAHRLGIVSWLREETQRLLLLSEQEIDDVSGEQEWELVWNIRSRMRDLEDYVFTGGQLSSIIARMVKVWSMRREHDDPVGYMRAKLLSFGGGIEALAHLAR